MINQFIYQVFYENPDTTAITSQYARLSNSFIDSSLVYTGDDLGVTYTGTDATFKLWTPPATEVAVHIFDSANQSNELTDPNNPIAMTKGANGVWSVTVSPVDVGAASLDGCFYQYELTVYGNDFTISKLNPNLSKLVIRVS